MPDRWKIVPTTRRTSKSDMVDILAADGAFIAGYVCREHAEIMVRGQDALSAHQLAADAIGLYREYVDAHGYDEDRAAAQAALDVAEGASIDVTTIEREMTKGDDRAWELTQDLTSLPF